MPRTALIDVDKTFDLDTEITKAWTDEQGRRIIRGVASGLEEDAQGERVTRACLKRMEAQAGQGLKLTSGHLQDWSTEIGDVVKVQHDPDHDELLVEAALPPEGEDPLADKAWTKLTKYGEKMGLSVGGKCRKAFYELTDTQKRRKVLDDIHLRHFALTKAPAYRPSFAEAVAKSIADEMPDPDEVEFRDEGEFPNELPEVGKADGNTAQTDQDRGGGQTGDRNAGEGKAKPKSTEDDDQDDDEDKDEPPEGAGERHLACPNCGHEFAADLPPGNAEDDNVDRLDEGSDRKPDRADKSEAQETDMPKTLDETLDTLKGLSGDTDEDAAKTGADDKPADDVSKDTAGDEARNGDGDGEYSADEVAKMLAASHRSHEEGFDKTNEALGEVAKSLHKLHDRMDKLPVGRRSVARVLPTRDEVEKANADDDPETAVNKRIEDADSPLEALKALNERDYGIK